MLENQTASRKQSSKEQLYGVDIERVRLVSSSLVKSSFAANQKDLSEVPASITCDSFGFANYLEARFVNVLVRLLFTQETSDANPAFMDVADL